MKRYLNNLWSAIIGADLYGAAHETKTPNLTVRSYQNLTENLRQRITDMEEQMCDMRRDYTSAVNTLRKQHQIERDEWAKRTEELSDALKDSSEQLQRVNKDVGREMMAVEKLKKTNAALNDLYEAMKSHDVDKMKTVVDYLNWNAMLSRVAQMHLDVLLRKQP